MHETKPEMIGLYNNGLKNAGGAPGTGTEFSATVPSATLTTEGVVKTCNASSAEVTSETVSVVPTMWYVQNAIAQLTGGTYTIPDGGTQGTVDIASAGTSETGKAGIIKPSSDYFTVAQNGYTTLNAATTQKAGVVTTCNSSSTQVTSETVAIVPTQHYVQTEVARLEQAISSAGGGGGAPVDAWTSTTDLGSVESATFAAGSSYILDASEGTHTITAVTSEGLTVGPTAKLTLYLGSLEDLTVKSPLAMHGDFREYSMNACTMHFINGIVYLIPDFVIPGYCVTVNTGITGSGGHGGLYYGLTSPTYTEIGFAGNTNESACALEDAVTAASKVITGNGRDVTILSGGMTLGDTCSFSHLTLQSAAIAGGKDKTVEDVHFDSCVDSGNMYLQGTNYVTNLQCAGGGVMRMADSASLIGPGTIDLGGKTHIVTSSSYSAKNWFSGITFSGGATSTGGGAVVVSQGCSSLFNDCTFESCTATSGIAIAVEYHASSFFSNCNIINNSGGKGTVNLAAVGYASFGGCTISSNTATAGGAIFNTAGSSANVIFSDCVLDGTMQLNGANATVTFQGSNAWRFGNTKQSSSTIFRIESGGTLDLTGNGGDNNGNIINVASGGVVVGYFNNGTWTEGGSATVINSAGETCTITGSGTKLTKAGVIA